MKSRYDGRWELSSKVMLLARLSETLPNARIETTPLVVSRKCVLYVVSSCLYKSHECCLLKWALRFEIQQSQLTRCSEVEALDYPHDRQEYRIANRKIWRGSSQDRSLPNHDTHVH